MKISLTTDGKAEKGGITMQEMCQVIEAGNIFEVPMTAEEIFNYSSTGELSEIFGWYEIAKDRKEQRLK